MPVISNADGTRAWRKAPLIKYTWLRWLVTVAVLVYAVPAVISFEIDVPRIIRGLGHGRGMILGFLQPDFIGRGRHILNGTLESLAMTVVACVVGITLSVPLALGGAKNISAYPVYLVCRAFMMVTRSLHVVVLSVLFVVMIGFGPLAGVLTLILNTFGFVGKLLAEDIENTNEEALDAVRATGASWLQQVVYGVWPQVKNRFIGLAIYRSDQNFRQSTVIGIVGAGGIGGVLDTALGRYEYSAAAAILLVIIGLVLIGEYVSSALRRRVT